jgi:transcriptional regulator with XRE-family HTH domain
VSSEDATPDPYADPLVFGQRLQMLRTRKGMTRDQLGGLLGKSGSWVKGVETGRLKTPKLETILHIAELLRVRDLSDLTGNQSVHVDLFSGPGHPRLAAVKAAVDAFPVTIQHEAPPAAHE